MFKANIKLPIWIAIVAIAISIGFTLLDFNPLSIIIYIGAIYLIAYFIVGYIKRIDALVIDAVMIKVTTPFRYHEIEIKKLRKVYLVDNSSQLKGILVNEDGENEITICSNIYDRMLSDIFEFLISNNEHLQ